VSYKRDLYIYIDVRDATAFLTNAFSAKKKAVLFFH
jgi:hypothetical protein